MVKNNKGFGLTESLVVFAVFAVITSGAILTYKIAYDDMETKKKQNTINTLTNIINDASFNSFSYNVEDIETDYDLQVKTGNWTNSDNDLITIKVNDFDRKSCANIVSNSFNEYFIITVNNSIVKATNNGDLDYNRVLDLCANEENTIAFNSVKKVDMSKMKELSLKIPDKYVEVDDETEDEPVNLDTVGRVQWTYMSGAGNASGVEESSTIRNVINSEFSGDTNSCSYSETDTMDFGFEKPEDFVPPAAYWDCSAGGYALNVFKRLHVEFWHENKENDNGETSEDGYVSQNEGAGITRNFTPDEQRIRMYESAQVRQACVMPNNTTSFTCQESLYY